MLEMEARLIEAVYQRLVVARHDERGAELVELLEESHQAIGQVLVDVAGGLVGDEEARATDHRARDRNALLLSARERRGTRLQVIGEADPGQELGHVLGDLRLRDAGDAERQRHVVEGREMLDQPEILEDDADPPPERRHLSPRRGRDLAAEERDQAARGTLGEIDQLQQARFAGAAGAGEEVEGAGLEMERDIAEYFRPRAVSHPDILETNQVRASILARPLTPRGRLCMSGMAA